MQVRKLVLKIWNLTCLLQVNQKSYQVEILIKLKKNGRIKLLKKIAYYFELYEWNGVKKMYPHIIRQIDNGIATGKHDFSEVETPLLIKYVKSVQKSIIREKLKRKRQYFIALTIKEINVRNQNLTWVK